MQEEEQEKTPEVHSDILPKIVAIIGQTASGKSDLAVEYALAHNGEIISADSRQIYKGLDIGTGKITHEEMRGIPHHMLDILSLGQEYSVAAYVHDVVPIIDDIISRGKMPILCGGTSQYVHAVIYAYTFPKNIENEAYEKIVSEKNNDELYALLSEKDATRAEEIGKQNRRRLIRALSILESGNSITPLVQTLRYDAHVIEMEVERDTLRERIKTRIDTRIEKGMLEEVKKVLEYTQDEEILKRYGLEYVELGNYIQGLCTLEEAKEKLFFATWHYAKRQKTYNKKYFAKDRG